MELRRVQNMRRPARAKAETRAGPGAAPTAAAETLAGQRQLHPKHSGKGRDDGVLIPINTHGQEAFK